MTAADLLAPGERCLAAGKGLHAKPKPGVVESTLGKRYMVLLDGDTEAQPFGLKKVKRLGKPTKQNPSPKPEAPVVDMSGFAEECRQEVADAVRRFAPGAAPDAALRDQRPPTRLHIPDANVPAVESGMPSLIRHSLETDPAFSYPRECARNYPTDAEVLRPQPKPHKPSRSAAYLQHVRRHDCCNCGAFGPSDPDHVGPRGVGQKTSDYLTIPLCRFCHGFRTNHNVLPDPVCILNNMKKILPTSKQYTANTVLNAQVRMLREWAEKLDKEIP